MKSTVKFLLLFVTFCLAFTTINAQTNCAKCLPSDASYTFLGIDYSLFKYVGIMDEKENKLRDTYMDSWNDLFINEQSKYDVAKMLKLKSVDYKVDHFATKNKSTKNIVQQKDPNYDDAAIKKHIQATSLKGITTDYAIWLIATAYDKPQENGNHYLVVYNVKQKQVLVQEKLVEKPRGFSFRNYWAYTYFKGLENVKNKKAKAWVK